MLEPQPVTVPPLRLLGYGLRTSNAAEADSSLAKIPSQWERFAAGKWLRRIPGQQTDRVICAAYYDYGTDSEPTPGEPVTVRSADLERLEDSTEYSFLLGAEVDPLAPTPRDMQSIQTSGGDYLIFEAVGPQPVTLIELWPQIRGWFDEHATVRRRFELDFERHDLNDPERVRVFISVRA